MSGYCGIMVLFLGLLDVRVRRNLASLNQQL